MQQLPPLSPFDVNSLEPTVLNATLRLPLLTTEDVQAATRAFSGVIADAGGIVALDNPDEMVEVLTRTLIAVATELMDDPAQVMECFDNERFAECVERECDVLVATGAAAAENGRWIEEKLKAWAVTEKQRGLFRVCAVTIAVGSLATLGRLPLTEMPETNLN